MPISELQIEFSDPEGSVRNVIGAGREWHRAVVRRFQQLSNKNSTRIKETLSRPATFSTSWHGDSQLRLHFHGIWQRGQYACKFRMNWEEVKGLTRFDCSRLQLDYIPRLMWQAQLHGNKTWTLSPTPECSSVCDQFSFYVESGDAVLVDTRIWYHGTKIKTHKEFSLTIQSEYG